MRMRMVLGVVAAVLLAATGALVVGQRRWNANSQLLQQQMESIANAALPVGAGSAISGTPSPLTPGVAVHNARFDVQQLNGLPAPVVRYFMRVLHQGQPLVRTARLQQSGEFRMGDSEDSWRPFTATEFFRVSRPGMLWDARIRQVPGMHVLVRDSYVAGVGRMRASMLGLVTVMDAPSDERLARAALQRYLAEAPWFPTALLPSSGVTWSPMSDTAALATLHDGSQTVSIEFRFSRRGEIMGTFTADRFRAVGAGYVATSWEGRFWQYEWRNGMLTPTRGEVAWRVDGMLRPYWRGQTVRAWYEFEP